MTNKTPILSYMEAVLLQRGSVSVGGQVKGLYLSVVGTKKIFSYLSSRKADTAVSKSGSYRDVSNVNFHSISTRGAQTPIESETTI